MRAKDYKNKRTSLLKAIKDSPEHPHIARDSFILYGLDQATINGEYYEFGVYKGHSLKLIAEKIYPKIVTGFDHFKGLSESIKTGAMRKTFELEKYPRFDEIENVRLVTGDIIETVKSFWPLKDCAYIHMDCDLYKPTIAVLKYLVNIVPGTIISFDEMWGHPGYERNEMRAFIESDLNYEVLAHTVHKVIIRINE